MYIEKRFSSFLGFLRNPRQVSHLDFCGGGGLLVVQIYWAEWFLRLFLSIRLFATGKSKTYENYLEQFFKLFFLTCREFMLSEHSKPQTHVNIIYILFSLVCKEIKRFSFIVTYVSLHANSNQQVYEP